MEMLRYLSLDQSSGPIDRQMDIVIYRAISSAFLKNLNINLLLYSLIIFILFNPLLKRVVSWDNFEEKSVYKNKHEQFKYEQTEKSHIHPNYSSIT